MMCSNSNSNSSINGSGIGYEFWCGQHPVANSEDTNSDFDISSDCPLKYNNRHIGTA